MKKQEREAQRRRRDLARRANTKQALLYIKDAPHAQASWFGKIKCGKIKCDECPFKFQCMTCCKRIVITEKDLRLLEKIARHDYRIKNG